MAYFGGKKFTKDEPVEKTFDQYHVPARSKRGTSELSGTLYKVRIVVDTHFFQKPILHEFK